MKRACLRAAGRRGRFPSIGAALLALLAAAPTARAGEPAGGQKEACRICHDSIENIHPFKDPARPALSCASCHLGDPKAAEVRPPAEVDADLARLRRDREEKAKERPAGGDFPPAYYEIDKEIRQLEGERRGLTQKAHTGMAPDPGDLRVVDKTCGTAGCHEETASRVRKSLHATNAGIIAAARYSVSRQKASAAEFTAGPDVADDDGSTPVERGAVASLRPVTKAGGLTDVAVEYLKKDCLRCHVNAADGVLLTTARSGSAIRIVRAPHAGEYRGRGCSACHVPYGPFGHSESLDPAVPRDAKIPAPRLLADHKEWRARPLRHELVTRPPQDRCLACHNCEYGTGLAFTGRLFVPENPVGGEGAGYAPDRLYGKRLQETVPDIHHEKGIACIDCHGEKDVHGDGNLWSRAGQGVAARCQSCHGTPSAAPPGTDGRGEPIPNLEASDGKFWLVGRLDGKRRAVPQLRDLKRAGKEPLAHAIPRHFEKLECYSCHTSWTARYYGRRVRLFDGDLFKDRAGRMSQRAMGFDFTATDPRVDATPALGLTLGSFSAGLETFRAGTPPLGMNSRGKISPFGPGPALLFTHDADRGRILEDSPLAPPDRPPGFLHDPVVPHTVRKEARSCESCHAASPEAFGWGSLVQTGPPRGKPWDQMADESGRPTSGSFHAGAGPLSPEEAQRIRSVLVLAGAEPRIVPVAPVSKQKVTALYAIVALILLGLCLFTLLFAKYAREAERRG